MAGELVTTAPAWHCNGIRKDRSGYCRQRAGFRTSHPGQGRCWKHGGTADVVRGTHLRYSTVRSTRIQDLHQQFAGDADPLNPSAELAMARAVLQDYLERYDVYLDALLAWKTAVDQGPGPILVWLWPLQYCAAVRRAARPTKVMDMAGAIGHIEAITRIIERADHLRAGTAIPRPELLRILGAMARVVEMYVPDEGVQQRIKRGWEGIKV